jgi:hypothetical protein
MPAQTKIQVRRDTAANWTSTNPTLSAGEIGFETDTGKFKYGTGSATWTALAYANGGGAVPQSQVTNLTTDLSGKQNTITGAATTIASADLTVSRALTSDASGKVAVSAVTATQLGHVSGVTSAIQTQLDGKSPLAGSTSITTVGTVTNATSPTAAGSTGLRRITISTAAPSGGADGDVWLRYV